MTAKYSYTHEYGLSLKPVAVIPSTTKIFSRRLCVPCGFIVPPTTLKRTIYTQKGTACTYVKGRKSARGGTAFRLRSIHTHTCIRCLSRNGASQNNQNISDAKYFGTSREQFRVLVHPQKKLHPQFRESPVL